MTKSMTAHDLNDRTRGWLRHLWRKAVTPDDWSTDGEPHPWWDKYSLEPMLSLPRFDLSESAYALLIMARKTPAWREVYTRILDEFIRRHTTYWAAVDWLTKIGPDPDRANYPNRYRPLIPRDLWGDYDVPGWTANGVEPWGLQPDPIGSDGNLFFRGFFTLLLGIHRAVSGEATWESPFEMAGLDDRTFPWTYTKIATYLSDHWKRNPEGPHCENTKVWPFCLSGAGLGLQMTDLAVGTNTHSIFDEWVEDTFKKRYVGFDARGNLNWVALYYDPLLERTHGRRRAFGLFPALYMLPQNRPMAEKLYRSGVASLGWDRWWMPVLGPTSVPRMFTVAMLLAREFGDHTTARRLERKLARFENGRFFDASGGSDEDEFGYFFKYDEPWPRGQESALKILGELLHDEGDWSRAFSESDADKFEAPTVVDVDYPQIGLSRARNDERTGTLEFETYAATRSAAGVSTRFRITQLPNPDRVSVRRDGAAYESWCVLDDGSVEIQTEIRAHRFDVYTGYERGALAVGQLGERPAAARSRPQSALARLRATELAPTLVSLRSARLGCPCCG